MIRILLGLCLGFVVPLQARGDVNPAEWTLKNGQRIRAEMIDYSWADRSLVLRAGGNGETQLVAAQDLDGPGKVRLLLAESFQDCVLAHRRELSLLPAHRERLESLRRWGVILCGVSVAGGIALSWSLSRLFLRRASLAFWLLAASLAIGLAVLGGWGVVAARARFGAENAAEMPWVVLGLHSVLLLFAIRVLDGGSFLRTFFWWLGHWMLIVVWPMLVLMVAVASQVYLHGQQLNEAAMERYLSEAWLVPMGLI
jgi:hypothetical protein